MINKLKNYIHRRNIFLHFAYELCKLPQHINPTRILKVLARYINNKYIQKCNKTNMKAAINNHKIQQFSPWSSHFSNFNSSAKQVSELF